jgi:hypothetical protein
VAVVKQGCVIHYKLVNCDSFMFYKCYDYCLLLETYFYSEPTLYITFPLYQAISFIIRRKWVVKKPTTSTLVLCKQKGRRPYTVWILCSGKITLRWELIEKEIVDWIYLARDRSSGGSCEHFRFHREVSEFHD